jgi:drug/metabolite transporter (DMT)-like permease
MPQNGTEGWANSASKLSAFTFITPLFGVVASYFVMHDTLNPVFGAAALPVIAGLYLVNRPGPVIPLPTDPLLNVTKT